MMTVFLQTLKERKWFIFWWALGITAFIGLNISVYPSLKDQTQALEQSFAEMPESLKLALSDTGEFFSPAGYLSSQVFYLMLPLLISILAIGLGSSLIGREERDGTLELLLARPVSRTRVMLAKFAAAVVITFGIGALTVIVTILLSKAVDLDVSSVGIAVAGLSATLLGFLFGMIAFTLSAMGKSARLSSVGIASLVAITSYLVSTLEHSAKWLEQPGKLLPYHYFKPARALEGTYEWGFPLSIALIILLLLVVSILSFRRRDLS